MDTHGKEEGRMPFLDHFSELRKRIFYVFIVIIICMGVSWKLSYKVIGFIELPLEQPTYITRFSGEIKSIIKKDF